MTTLSSLLTTPATFSEKILKLPLHNYQIRPLSAILHAILHATGDEFLIIMPRQSGKNEAIAHLLVMLLNLFQRTGGNIVYGAIGDGIGRGIGRLEARLENPLNRGRWSKAAKPTRRIIGKAQVVFLSSHPAAYSRGETASIALIIDELQDQVAPHLEAVFEPMRAARNAPAIYLGTVKFTHDALWQKKLELERKTAQDGLQRVFFIMPDEVTAENPHYNRFLAAKIALHGRNHPIVASEYFLEPIDGTGGLFPPRRIALMHGSHSRRHQPEPGKLYVAVLDIGGEDEGATDPIAQLENPGRDYTTCTIFEIQLPSNAEQDPIFYAVDILADQGSKHFESYPGRPNLASQLLAFLNHWGILHLVGDDTGTGTGLISWLKARLPSRVTGYTFTATSKASLGSNFLSLIETGRFKYWIDDENTPLSDGWWFWQQASACSYEIPPNGRFEQHLKWGVKATHKTHTPSGALPTHDDRLLSAALVARYDTLLKNGTIILSTGQSAIIPPADPFANMEF